MIILCLISRTGKHGCGFGKQIGQLAGMAGIKMLHQDKCHARIIRQMCQQLGERFQPASRRSNANNRKRNFAGYFSHCCHYWQPLVPPATVGNSTHAIKANLSQRSLFFPVKSEAIYISDILSLKD